MTSPTEKAEARASAAGYEHASWLSANWDPDILSRDARTGLLRAYRPLVHYMARETSGRLGASLAERDAPVRETM